MGHSPSVSVQTAAKKSDLKDLKFNMFFWTEQI